MLARVAERQKVDARAATLLAHAVPACAAGSSDNASAVAVSVPAVSLLQRGESRTNLCASNAGSPAKGPQSTAASFAGDPLPQLESGGKKSQAQLVIERLPLVQILQGQSLGRTLTPAYGQVEKWKLDQDEKVRNSAAVLALHLGWGQVVGARSGSLIPSSHVPHMYVQAVQSFLDTAFGGTTAAAGVA